MKVYTKGGDSGHTSLIGGERVPKYDIRVEAYGTVDELSAFIALLSDKMRSDDTLEHYNNELQRIGSMLMNIEAHLASGAGNSYKLPQVTNQSVESLEESIDKMQSALPQITKFTLAGGCELNSLSHICRTICRRAERLVAQVAQQHEIAPNVLQYLNRLSDYLYLLGRTLTAHCQADEIVWIPEV